jgi:hypothetical protein
MLGGSWRIHPWKGVHSIQIFIASYLNRYSLDNGVSLTDRERQLLCLEEVASLQRRIKLPWRLHLFHDRDHLLSVFLLLFLLCWDLSLSAWRVFLLCFKESICHYAANVAELLQNCQPWLLIFLFKECLKVLVWANYWRMLSYHVWLCFVRFKVLIVKVNRLLSIIILAICRKSGSTPCKTQRVI